MKLSWTDEKPAPPASPPAPAKPPSPLRPRGEVIDDLMIQLARLELTINDLGLPPDNELSDFVNLIRCRLRPLQDGDQKRNKDKHETIEEILSEPEEPALSGGDESES